jgi:aspartate aminotransferase
MLSISDLGKAIPASPMRKLVHYSEEAERKGRKVYHLNIGQPDIPTPEVALNALRNINLKVIEYSHSAGNESYRRKLAACYQKIGINIDHTETLLTTGGSEAILFALMSCVNPGEEVITPVPFYANYNGFATTVGTKIVPVTSYIKEDFSLPPIKEIEKKIIAKTKCIIICNPNYPTGYLYSKEKLLHLKEIVKKYDLFLFSDEAYREFCYDRAEHFSSMNLEDFEYNNQTVMVAPASGFYSTPRSGKNEVRIAYVLKIDDLKNARETLAEALNLYSGRVKN